MTSRSTRAGQQAGRLEGGWRPRWWVVLGLIGGLLLTGGWQGATAQERQPVLQAVDISPLAGNRLQIRFRLSERPSAPPSTFTINEPARIVLDFLGTRNGLATRQQAINVGVADRLSVLEGADRTRASLNLARLVPYRVDVQGNAVVLTLDQAGAPAARTPAATTTAAVRAAAATSRRDDAPLPAAGPRRVSEVNFRRGPRGQGIVTIKLSASGIPVDVRQEGNQIIADFQGAALPRGQERRLDVTDFATPVMTVEALNVGNNARMSVQSTPPFEFLAYQADDLYVVEVSPPEKSDEELEREARLDPTKKVYTGDLLSLNFQDIEVRAILQILADFTGLNIVVSDSVTGNLTLRLQNVPWDQALDIIMRTKGLSSRQSGNVIFIAPTEEITARERLDLESRRTVEELIPLRTEIIQVNYAKAADLRDLIREEKGDDQQSMLSPRGEISVDERTNSLIIKDVPDTLIEIRELVAVLDVPTRQVLIDSRVVIANESFSRDLGVRFGVSGVRETGSGLNAIGGNLAGTDQIIGSAVDNLINTGQPFPVAVPELADRLGVNLPVDGAPSLALAILGSDYLVDLELSALQVEGNGEIVSNPRVVTTDRQEAKIVQGQVVKTILRGADDDAEFTTEALLELTVTPQITPDDRITMDLKVTKNDLVSAAETQTITDNREVETQVLVNNGETVVLGGVFDQTKADNQRKVPVLGDLPVLGYLFRTTSRSTAKRELLIFVTPQILRDGSSAER